MDTVPETFNFPFKPYPIQENFMRELFKTLSSHHLGIFESPTGTGKSLSLICGSLTWLNHYESNRVEELKKKMAEGNDINDAEDEDDDWIASAVKKKEKQDEKLELKKELEFLLEKIEKIKDLRKRRQKIHQPEIHKIDADFDDLFRDAKEIQEAVKRELSAMSNGFSPEEQDHILDDYLSGNEDNDDANIDAFEEKKDYSIRIFYCSRTHSQLSQFVKEVQKTKFAQDIRLVSLASRGNMCINDSVLALKNQTLINEKCLDMQKKKSDSKKRDDDPNPAKKQRKSPNAACPFYKSAPIGRLRDQALLQVQDIEEMVKKGREIGACPYYASRKAVDDAQVIVVPYNTLLHSSTREACGLNLDNAVVIIDEAHNVLETIAHIHSAEITRSHLEAGQDQLKAYFNKYSGLLKAKNLLYIKQILFILAKLISVFAQNSESKLMLLSDFLTETEMFGLNLFKLIKYIEKSKICYKLQGFSMQLKNQEPPKKKGVAAFLQNVTNTGQSQAKEEAAKKRTDEVTTSSPMLPILAFLQALVNSKSELRILMDVKKVSIKALILNPGSQFSDLVKRCRSIIVAGGTMQPIDEFRDQLFVSAGAELSRIANFSCGHIVPPENVLPIVIKSGPSGKTLDFTFQNRDSVETYQELSRALVNSCNVIPGGVVVFFPSYDYEARVFSYFEKSGVIQKLEMKKKVYREPKKTSDLDQVLRDYSRSAKHQGAVLFSVVGGKMSEGINFSDDLGRCVIMVGLPFPNAHSPELKEKMAYLNANVAPNAGQVHYENLCMKAVNQSIGRAIRHKDDYACILLLDQRYDKPSILGQLPGWIKTRVDTCDRFGPVMSKVTKFFKEKR